MQKERLTQRQSQLELRHEPFLLLRMRRVVAVEVEAAFADGDDARMLCDFLQLIDRGRAAIPRMVRMYASGGIEIETFGDLARSPAFGDGRAGNNECGDTHSSGACDDRLEVVVKARMRQ